MPVELEDHDLTRGLNEGERRIFAALLTKRAFQKGTNLIAEGEPGDRMWLIMKGSVDVRLRNADMRGSRRIANLATGTTVGEMALIENIPRSASIIATEDVECLELDRANYETIMLAYPRMGTKLLTNLIQETMRRLRNTSQQLRGAES